MGTWFPEHERYFLKLMRDLQLRHPHLRPHTDGSCFPASTVNVGPQTACLPHRDCRNFLWGICLLYTAGLYDAAKGGHLILHEARRIIPLHPGDTILFPSACITHENIPVAGDAVRYSLTGHIAADLGRYRDAGYRTYETWKVEDPFAYKEHQAKGDQRWEEGHARFLTLEELKSRWMGQSETQSLNNHVV